MYKYDHVFRLFYLFGLQKAECFKSIKLGSSQNLPLRFSWFPDEYIQRYAGCRPQRVPHCRDDLYSFAMTLNFKAMFEMQEAYDGPSPLSAPLVSGSTLSRTPLTPFVGGAPP